MATRGRKSAASQAFAALGVSVSTEKRIEAPLHLSDAERNVWIATVNDSPASAFSAKDAPLLAMYCRHVVQADIIADELINFDRAWLSDDDGLKRYDRLLAMQEREGRAASSLATRLRLTRQATDHPTTAGRAQAKQAKARKPWELPESAE